jgi:hypothetical protein
MSQAEVWCVFAQTGEYENWSNDLRGIFATKELADQHAAHDRCAAPRPAPELPQGRRHHRPRPQGRG